MLVHPLSGLRNQFSFVLPIEHPPAAELHRPSTKVWHVLLPPAISFPLLLCLPFSSNLRWHVHAICCSLELQPWPRLRLFSHQLRPPRPCGVNSPACPAGSSMSFGSGSSFARPKPGPRIQRLIRALHLCRPPLHLSLVTGNPQLLPAHQLDLGDFPKRPVHSVERPRRPLLSPPLFLRIVNVQRTSHFARPLPLSAGWGFFWSGPGGAPDGNTRARFTRTPCSPTRNLERLAVDG